MDWAGPHWVHIPKTRPEWAAKARETITGQEEGEAKVYDKDEEPRFEQLDARSLRKLQKR